MDILNEAFSQTSLFEYWQDTFDWFVGLFKCRDSVPQDNTRDPLHLFNGSNSRTADHEVIARGPQDILPMDDLDQIERMPESPSHPPSVAPILSPVSPGLYPPGPSQPINRQARNSAIVRSTTMYTGALISPANQTSRPHDFKTSHTNFRRATLPTVTSASGVTIQTKALKGLKSESKDHLIAHSSSIQHLQFSPDGSYLATCRFVLIRSILHDACIADEKHSQDQKCVIYRVQGPFDPLHTLAHPKAFGIRAVWSVNGPL